MFLRKEHCWLYVRWTGRREGIGRKCKRILYFVSNARFIIFLMLPLPYHRALSHSASTLLHSSSNLYSAFQNSKFPMCLSLPQFHSTLPFPLITLLIGSRSSRLSFTTETIFLKQMCSRHYPAGKCLVIRAIKAHQKDIMTEQ